MGPTPRRSSATSFAGSVEERFSLRWLRTTVDHNRPHLDELADPLELVAAGILHARLRHAGFTMLSSRHARTLHRLARRIDAEGVPGAIVDCGVWNGGSSALLSHGAPSRTVYSLDSFEGLPPPTAVDGPDSAGWEGRYRGSPERVTEAFRRIADPGQLRIVPGWFEETAPRIASEVEAVALLHVDADWYESVRTVLDIFAPKLMPGGFVIIDDYPSWIGARRAADEHRAERSESAPMVEEHWWRVSA